MKQQDEPAPAARCFLALLTGATLIGCGAAATRSRATTAPARAPAPADSSSTAAAPAARRSAHTFLTLDAQGAIRLSAWAKRMMPAVASALDRATITKASVDLEAGHPATASVHLETATALDQSALFAPKPPGAPNMMFDTHHVDVTLDSGNAWAEAAWTLWHECVGDRVLPTQPDVLRAALKRTERKLGSGSDIRAFVVSNGSAGAAVLAWAHADHIELEAGTPTPLRATSDAFRIQVTDGRPLGILLQCARRYAGTAGS